jgi:hypothetical protein
MSTSFGGASILALIEIVCYIITKKRGKNMKTAAFGAAFVASSVLATSSKQQAKI